MNSFIAAARFSSRRAHGHGVVAILRCGSSLPSPRLMVILAKEGSKMVGSGGSYEPIADYIKRMAR